MNPEPWFDAIRYAWIPGTCLGVLGGLLGTLGGVLAPQGKAKGLVLGIFLISILASVVLLAAGGLALVLGQPYGVWYFLGLPGLIGTVVIGGLFPVVLIRYREAERRKMSAQDL